MERLEDQRRQWEKWRWRLGSLMLGLGLSLSGPVAGQAQLPPGEVLVTDSGGGTTFPGFLFQVNPDDGSSTVLSNFGAGASPAGVAVEADGQILVVTTLADPTVPPTLFRVNPSDGSFTVLSNFRVGANPGVAPHGIAVEADGQIVAIDSAAGTNGRGALFRINPSDGSRTVLSDFGVGANPGVVPLGVAVEADRQILVIDSVAGTNGQGALFRVNPSDGSRTMLSDFGAGANQGAGPVGVAVEVDGQILVIDPGVGTNNRGVLFRVNPSDGSRTVLSDFGVGANPGVFPVGVAVEVDGQILVIDPAAGPTNRGILFRVNPSDGSRTVLSDLGVDLSGVAVVPADATLSLLRGSSTSIDDTSNQLTLSGTTSVASPTDVSAASVASPIDLSAATVTIHRVLHEKSGAGELLHHPEHAALFPLVLAAGRGSRENHAAFTTPSGTDPQVRLQLSLRDGELRVRLRMTSVGVKDPHLCEEDTLTDLHTHMVIDDGVHEPLSIYAVESWRCVTNRRGEIHVLRLQ